LRDLRLFSDLSRVTAPKSTIAVATMRVYVIRWALRDRWTLRGKRRWSNPQSNAWQARPRDGHMMASLYGSAAVLQSGFRWTSTSDTVAGRRHESGFLIAARCTLAHSVFSIVRDSEHQPPAVAGNRRLWANWSAGYRPRRSNGTAGQTRRYHRASGSGWSFRSGRVQPVLWDPGESLQVQQVRPAFPANRPLGPPLWTTGAEWGGRTSRPNGWQDRQDDQSLLVRPGNWSNGSDGHGGAAGKPDPTRSINNSFQYWAANGGSVVISDAEITPDV